jgi:hypothetical protein
MRMYSSYVNVCRRSGAVADESMGESFQASFNGGQIPFFLTTRLKVFAGLSPSVGVATA